MDQHDNAPHATVSARLEREVYERFARHCEALGTTRSAYIRALILREIDSGDERGAADPITTVTLGALVSQRLLAAVPPDILDEAVDRLRRERKAAQERKKGQTLGG